MANKRLSGVEIEQMKTMVSEGVAPEDIATKFGVAISSVHNYKKRFKEEGLAFPSVRGKRPTGVVEPPKSSQPVKQTKAGRPTKDKSVARVARQPKVVSGVQAQDGINLVVNGVSVQVSAQAKNVSIGKNSIEINF